MAQSIEANGTIKTKERAMASRNGKMAQNMLASGAMTKQMAMAS